MFVPALLVRERHGELILVECVKYFRLLLHRQSVLGVRICKYNDIFRICDFGGVVIANKKIEKNLQTPIIMKNFVFREHQKIFCHENLFCNMGRGFRGLFRLFRG